LFRTILYAATENKLMCKAAKIFRSIFIFKNGAPVAVNFLERKEKILTGSRNNRRRLMKDKNTPFRIIPGSFQIVSATMAKVLLSTNQAKLAV